MSPNYEYSSTQINLHHLLANDIMDWGDQHIDDKNLYVDYNNPIFGREDEPHITILNGLHQEYSHNIQMILENIEPFEIKLGIISIFTICPKFDVIKIDVESPILYKLNSILKQIPHTQFYQHYKPHITIAYIKKGECQKLLGNTTFSGQSWTAKHITFSSKFGEKTILPLKFKHFQRKIS